METDLSDSFRNFINSWVINPDINQNLPTLIGGVVAIGLLLFLSGLISGSELAFFSFNREDVDSMRKSRKPAQQRISRLLSRPKLLLATILVTNNFVNVAIVTISTFLTWEVFDSEKTGGQLVALLSVLVTFFIVFFGEVTPKVLANQSPLNFARTTVNLLSLAQMFFYPVSLTLLRLSQIVEKRIEKKGYQASIDALTHALELTTDTSTSPQERVILRRIVNFGTISAKDIMCARTDIFSVEADIDFHDLMDKINKAGFSRIPVFSETIDKIDGILYIKDMLPHINEQENFDWKTLLREPYFIPETKKIDDLLREFQQRRQHIAIIVDEYGGTSGLITLEDIIEEIVGDINDELDQQNNQHVVLANNMWVFEGKVSVNDFLRISKTDPKIFEEIRGESGSLSGLLLEINHDMPKQGEKIVFKNFEFVVTAADKRRIKKIKVTKNKITSYVKKNEEKLPESPT